MKKVNFKGIKTKLITVATVPLLYSVILLTVLSVVYISSGMRTEALGGLTMLADSVRGSYLGD